MESIRIGTLNIIGGRDPEMQAAVAELMKLKHIDVLLLQETHSTVDNEADWRKVWLGPVSISHGSNVSAGVAVLVSDWDGLAGATHLEVDGGRLQVVQGTVRETHFVFINIYAYNSPVHRAQLMQTLNRQQKL